MVPRLRNEPQISQSLSRLQRGRFDLEQQIDRLLEQQPDGQEQPEFAPVQQQLYGLREQLELLQAQVRIMRDLARGRVQHFHEMLTKLQDLQQEQVSVMQEQLALQSRRSLLLEHQRLQLTQLLQREYLELQRSYAIGQRRGPPPRFRLHNHPTAGHQQQSLLNVQLRQLQQQQNELQQQQPDDIVQCAIRTFHSDVCNWLLEMNRQFAQIGQYAHTASIACNMLCWSLLLDRGLSIHFASNSLPFHACFSEFCRHGRATLCSLMLSFLEGNERYSGLCFGMAASKGWMRPILAIAARSGSLRVLKLLCESDRVDIKSHTFFAAMKMAAKHGHIDAFQYLQNHQRCPKRYPGHFFTECLTVAILWRNPQLVSYLSELVTEIEGPLRSACQVDDVELVELLLAKNTKPNLDITPFVATAVSFCSESVLVWFFKPQSAIDCTQLSKPLMNAGCYGHIAIVRMIFDRLPTEQQREISSRLMDKAIQQRNLDLVDLFSSLGVSGDNLCMAVELSSLEIVKKLVSRSDSPDIVNARNADWATPLTLAARHSREDIAVYLLSCPGILPSLYDRMHMTSLIHAAYQGSVVITKAILEHYGARVSERIPEINRALRKAMKAPSQPPNWQLVPENTNFPQSKAAIILALLAIPGIESNPIVKGETLLHFAARIGSLELLKELLKVTHDDVNDLSDSGTALMIALENGSDAVSRALIECPRVNVNYGFKDYTTLQAAVQGSGSRVLKLLINSPRFDAKCHDAVSAFNFAIIRQNLDICQTLVESELFQIPDHLPLITTLMLHGNEQLIDFFLPHIQCSERVLHNAAVLGNVRIVDHALRTIGADVNVVIDTWQPQGQTLAQLRQQHQMIRQQFVGLQQPQAAQLYNWEQLYTGRPQQANLRQEQVLTLQQELTLLVPSATSTLAKEPLLAVAVLSASQAVTDLIVNDAKFDPRANTMKILKMSIQRPSCGPENAAMRIALRLPNIDINGIFEDGSSPLTSLFSSKSPITDQQKLQTLSLDLDLDLEAVMAVPGVDVDRPDHRGQYVLIECLKRGGNVLPALLGRADVDWNVRDQETLDTPLIILARIGHVSAFQLEERDALLAAVLKKPGVDVNAQNRDGNTAAIEAVKGRRSLGFASIASREDCRLDIANNVGETVMSIAGCQLAPDATRSEIIDDVSDILFEISGGFGAGMGDEFDPDVAEAAFSGDDEM
jgi:ankyrin repeat protein